MQYVRFAPTIKSNNYCVQVLHADLGKFSLFSERSYKSTHTMLPQYYAMYYIKLQLIFLY